MSLNTPKRFAIQKKRTNNGKKSTDSPSQKNLSGRKEKEGCEPPKCKSKLTLRNSIQMECYPEASFTTPKGNRNRRREKNFAKTPTSGFNSCCPDSFQEKDNSFKQQKQQQAVSPGLSPFTLTQMPSTQDCEIGWDCNSPGYSYEELKKREKSCSPSPVTPVIPNRLLFNRLKRPPAPLQSRKRVKNSSFVAAQLDDLLNKVNGDVTKEPDDNDSQSEDGKLPEYFTCNILNASSQPFEVSLLEPNVSFAANARKTALSVEKSEREEVQRCVSNEGCNSANSNLVEILGKDASDLTKTSIPSSTVPTSKVMNENVNKDTSFSSTDEDMFSESFLKSTQELENAHFKNIDLVDPHLEIRNEEKPLGSLSRITKKTPTVLFSDTVADAPVVNCCWDESEAQNGKDMKKIAEAKKADTINPLSPSPVIGKARKSPEGRVFAAEAFKFVAGDNPRKAENGYPSICISVPLSTRISNREEREIDSGYAYSKESKPKRRACFQLNPLNERPSQSVLRDPDKENCMLLKPASITCLTNGNSRSEHANNAAIKDESRSDKNNFSNKNCGQTLQSSQISPLSHMSPLTNYNSDLFDASSKSSEISSLNFNFSQEKDDDDDDDDLLFASMIPSLVAVETAHTKLKLVQSTSNGENKLGNKDLVSQAPTLLSSYKNNIEPSFKNMSAYDGNVKNVGNKKATNPVKQSIVPINTSAKGAGGTTSNYKHGASSLDQSSLISHFSIPKGSLQNRNLLQSFSSLHNKNKSVTPTPMKSIEKKSIRTTTSVVVTSPKTESEEGTLFNVTERMEEDDDDIFMQDDFLNGISLVETQYLASHTQVSKPTTSSSHGSFVDNCTQETLSFNDRKKEPSYNVSLKSTFLEKDTPAPISNATKANDCCEVVVVVRNGQSVLREFLTRKKTPTHSRANEPVEDVQPLSKKNKLANNGGSQPMLNALKHSNKFYKSANDVDFDKSFDNFSDDFNLLTEELLKVGEAADKINDALLKQK